MASSIPTGSGSKKPKMQTGWNKFSGLRRSELLRDGIEFAEAQKQAGQEWKDWKVTAARSLQQQLTCLVDDEGELRFAIAAATSDAIARMVDGEFSFSVKRGPRVKPTALAREDVVSGDVQTTTSMKTVPNLQRTKPPQCLTIRRKKFLCGECNDTVKVHADEDGDFFCPTCNYELI